MNRLHRGMRIIALGTVLAGSVAMTFSTHGFAQDQALDTAQRAQLAAITLDQETLPDGYTFVGEAFLTASQVASGDVTADSLTGAGFLGQYVSVYENGSDKSRIRSYASLWKDEASAEAGFAIIEDETKSSPDASLTDGDASVGDTPREVTTGTYAEGDATIGTADVTFRSGSFLVGVAVEKTDGSEASTDTADALAKTVSERATAVVGGTGPEFTDLALPAQTLPLAGLGTEVQAGFISPAEAEGIYGLQGSALNKLTASWTDTVGVGPGDGQIPYVTVGVTTFASADDAKAVVDGAADLIPSLDNGKAIDGATVDGADAVAAFEFTSKVTGGDATDSYRILFTKGSTLVVIDVQGAKSADIAKAGAESLAKDQIGCIGQTECAAPTLSDDLTK
jgi:hypothetical protein